MRTTLFAAAIAALSLSACAATDKPVVATMAGPGVRIEAVKATPEGDLIGVGSGVYIGNGVIITAAHVLEGAKSFKVMSDAGDAQGAEVLWVNEAYDIAAIKPNNKRRFASAELDCREPAVGEPIRAMGNPAGVSFIQFKGDVSGEVRPLNHWKSVFITDMTTIGGVSGGPVYASDGDVIGINVGTLGYGGPEGGMGFAVPASAVCMLLGRA